MRRVNSCHLFCTDGLHWNGHCVCLMLNRQFRMMRLRDVINAAVNSIRILEQPKKNNNNNRNGWVTYSFLSLNVLDEYHCKYKWNVYLFMSVDNLWKQTPMPLAPATVQFCIIVLLCVFLCYCCCCCAVVISTQWTSIFRI